MVTNSPRAMNESFGAHLPATLSRAIDRQASLSAAEKAAAKSDLPRIDEVNARESDRYLGDPKLIAEMKEVTMNVMAKHFTLEEVPGVTAFYQAPIETRLVAEMPQVMSEAIQASMELTRQRLGSTIETMTGEMLAKPTLAPAN
jgi:hypothetical protein